MEQKKLVFRTLTADEIECRVGNVAKDQNGEIKGFFLLLYKTARVDANILDETVGCFNWQKRFYQVKNTMICEIAINVNYNDSTKEPVWVSKCDGGDDDFQTEKVKGECSDSMKRAGFQWGIGRELYFGPKIYISSDKATTKDYFNVVSVAFDDKKVMTEITIENSKTHEIVFSYPKGTNTSQNGNKPPRNPKSTEGSGKGTIRPSEKDKLNKFIATLDQDKLNKFIAWLDQRYHTININELSDEEGIMVCVSWKL